MSNDKELCLPWKTEITKGGVIINQSVLGPSGTKLCCVAGRIRIPTDESLRAWPSECWSCLLLKRKREGAVKKRRWTVQHYLLKESVLCPPCGLWVMNSYHQTDLIGHTVTHQAVSSPEPDINKGQNLNNLYTHHHRLFQSNTYLVRDGECFVCMYACISHECLVPEEARRLDSQELEL